MDKPYKYCNHFNEFKYINFTFSSCVGLRGAMVARLTPDQKAACSSHVGVTKISFLLFFLSRNTSFHLASQRIVLENRFSLPALS